MKFIFQKCPICGAKEGEPCHTPKGREMTDVHKTRTFVVATEKAAK